MSVISQSRREDLLARAEAAAYLGVSISWLARRQAGIDGPAEVRLGRRVYYRMRDLDDYIDNTCRSETWASTNGRRPQSGGTASKSTASTTVGRRAKQVVEQLRESLEKSAPRPSPELQLVTDVP